MTVWDMQVTRRNLVAWEHTGPRFPAMALELSRRGDAVATGSSLWRTPTCSPVRRIRPARLPAPKHPPPRLMLHRLRCDFAAVVAERDAARHESARLRASRSYRLAAPLRWLRRQGAAWRSV